MLIAPEVSLARARNADSPSDDVAVALLPSSKLIDLLAVVPPIEIDPDVARVIRRCPSVLQPLP